MITTPLRIGIEYRPSVQTQHLALFLAITVVAVACAIWIYRTRRTRGARLFALSLLLLAGRAFSDVVHALVGELWTLQSILVGVNPLLEVLALLVFVRFAGRYANVEAVSDERTRRMLAGVAVATALVLATNPLHSLAFTGFEPVTTHFTHVVGTPGPAGVALVAIEALLVLGGAVLLAHAFTDGRTPAWWPATVLAVAVGQAALIGGVKFLGGGTVAGYDYGGIALGGFFLLTTLALWDHGLRRIEVVAREAIVDEIDDAVVFLDADGTPIDANPAADRLFPDLDGETPFGDRFDEPLLPTTAEPLRAEITLESAPAVAVDHQVGSNPSTADAGVHEDRDERHFIVHTTPVSAGTGELLGYAVRFVDVTQLKRRSRELARTNERLDQFATTVSHDLRNPLNVASGYLELVDEAIAADGDGFDLGDAIDHLETVGTSLERMNAIIADILALVEDADATPSTEPVDFERITRAAWDSVETGPATLTVADDDAILADPNRLQRLLENLLRNSIDHVGGAVSIEVGCRDGRFYVADDGPGIDPADRDRIFDDGYTTDEEGTGLGLSIVAQLAEGHGWDVAVDPDHDGARFVVIGCETLSTEPSPGAGE